MVFIHSCFNIFKFIDSQFDSFIQILITIL
jgi:hypothetical protein